VFPNSIILVILPTKDIKRHLLFFSFFPPQFFQMRNRYNRNFSLERLDYYYQVINITVLSKQNPASGLIPASVAITVKPFNQ
jgi:hypothetical protein